MKPIYKIALAIGTVGILIFAGNATATTFSFEDTGVNWPAYSSTLIDTNETPQVKSINVTVANGLLIIINIVLDQKNTQRQVLNFFPINTFWTSNNSSAWNSWNYFIHDGGTPSKPVTSTKAFNGNTVVSDYLYKVADDFNCLFSQNKKRIDSPDGNTMDSLFGAKQTDIMGGCVATGSEPATMLLFGTGLVCLAGYGKKRVLKKLVDFFMSIF